MSKKYYRTDFIDELVETNNETEYFTQQIRNYNSIKTNHILLKKNHKSIGKPIGDYFSISFNSTHEKNQREDLENVIIKNLHFLYNKFNITNDSKVLVVGMGNQHITPDALGPQVIKKIMITNHLFLEKHLSSNDVLRVSAIIPGVMGTTGLETSDIIKGVVKQFKPDLVICIDALATKSLTRINKAIQISDTGISPGSGIGNRRKRIDYKTLNCPVLTIGVATVVDSLSMFYEFLDFTSEIIKLNLTNTKIKKINKTLIEEEMHLIVTPKEIDEDIKNLSEVIANSLNKSLHHNFNNL